VSLAEGTVRYAVVALDQAWGPEDKRYAMPLKAFKPGQRMQDDFVLNVNRDMVARVPSFDKGRWPDLNDAGWTRQSDRSTLAYGAGAMGAAGQSAATAANATGTREAARDQRAVQERRANAPDQQAGMTQRNMRLSQLIGKDVRNMQGEDLGDIKDVVVDVGNGRVHYVVLSFGGFLGLGDKQFAYPMKVFRPAADKDELVLNVDKEQLKKAPGFEQAREPDWNQAEYRGQVDRYFGDMVRVEPRQNMRLIRGSNLIGKDVNGANGEQIGEIEDVVVSLADGDARYAVVAFDKAWSLDEKRFVFPLKAFQTGQRLQDDFRLNVSREMLARVPSFERNQWPDINNARWNVDVDRYLLTMKVTPLPSTTRDAEYGKSDANRRSEANRGGSATQPEQKKNDLQSRQMFDRLDKDKDGRISRAEFSAAHQQ
jgi:sporulation protein YlmC with PRC-barrel domain